MQFPTSGPNPWIVRAKNRASLANFVSTLTETEGTCCCRQRRCRPRCVRFIWGRFRRVNSEISKKRKKIWFFSPPSQNPILTAISGQKHARKCRLHIFAQIRFDGILRRAPRAININTCFLLHRKPQQGYGAQRVFIYKVRCRLIRYRVRG